MVGLPGKAGSTGVEGLRGGQGYPGKIVSTATCWYMQFITQCMWISGTCFQEIYQLGIAW